jgi:osmotically-inducible protein OsmY
VAKPWLPERTVVEAVSSAGDQKRTIEKAAMKKTQTRRNPSPAMGGLGFGIGLLAAIAGTTGCATSNHFDPGLAGQIQDRGISYRVSAALEEEPFFRYRAIRVETVDGMVELRGFAESQAQTDRAGDLTRTVKGVREVANNIEVGGP